MTILFMDGFDHYNGADVLNKWSWQTSAVSTSISYAFSPPSGGKGIYTPNVILKKMLASSYSTGLMGFYWKAPTQLKDIAIAYFYDNVYGEQCSVRLTATGYLIVSRNGSTLATSTNTVTLSSWYHIEFKATIHNTTGQYEVRVNGSSTGWIPQSTADKNTRGQTANSFSAVGITSSDNSTYFDDFYVLNCDSAPNNTFLGPQKILTLRPLKQGNYSQWTPNCYENFTCVNDFDSDSTTFNYTTTSGNIDSFSLLNLPNSTIAGIQHTVLARYDGTAHQLAFLERSGSTDYVGTAFNLGITNAFYMETKDVDPATSAAFVYTNINAAEFGYKLMS